MLAVVDGDPVAERGEVAVAGRQHGLGQALDVGLRAAAVVHHLVDRDHLQAVLVGERAQVVAALHGPVVVDHLDEHAGRRQPGHPGKVDRGLGVAAPDQHTALAVAQREDVPRAGDLPRLGRGVGQHPRGVGAVGGRDPGGDAVAGVHGDGVRRAELVLVVRRHQRDLEPVEHLGRHRHADHAAGVADRERHQLRGRPGGGEDDVALVLAVLVVDDHDRLPGGDVGDRLLDVVEAHSAMSGGRCIGHGFTIFSTYFAITSTSRLTRSPACLKPSVVRARVSGIRLTVNDSAAHLHDRQGDPVDGDRALRHQVALEVGGQGDLDELPVLARRTPHHGAGGVDVALDDVAAEPGGRA